MTRSSMPTLAAIQAHWGGLEAEQLRATFPGLRSFTIGWGEPFCFRCGWLAPGREAADYPAKWEAARVLAAVWSAKGGWLERAHLHDHSLGGTETPDNLVPLCAICHEEQPICPTRETGLSFVNSRSPFADLIWLQQVLTDEWYGQTKVNPVKAHRSMLRARARVAEVLAEVRA